jgi:hypothetical protein
MDEVTERYMGHEAALVALRGGDTLAVERLQQRS